MTIPYRLSLTIHLFLLILILLWVSTACYPIPSLIGYYVQLGDKDALGFSDCEIRNDYLADMPATWEPVIVASGDLLCDPAHVLFYPLSIR